MLVPTLAPFRVKSFRRLREQEEAHHPLQMRLYLSVKHSKHSLQVFFQFRFYGEPAQEALFDQPLVLLQLLDWIAILWEAEEVTQCLESCHWS